jgi:primary-amine oxidase
VRRLNITGGDELIAIFYSGEYGMGTMANELSLGCDCLGQIHYLVLSLNTCGTTFFSQDGSIEFEIRLTGILQVYVAGPNEPAPYATRVAPGINAHFHQHLFSVRIDPMVDGLLNSVIETDVLPATAGYGSPENFAGNAFQVHDRVLSHANEGARTWDALADRRWRIKSVRKRHHASGQLEYSIGVKGGATVALLWPEGWVGRRATFARNTLWVVCEKEDVREGGWMWPWVSRG